MKTTKQALKKLDKLVGTPIDADNFGGNQCVDVIKWFIRELYDKPYSFGGAAYKLWTNDDWFRHEACVPFDAKYGINKYTAGDILVYNKTKKNPFGHVAICANTVEDYKDLIVYEQNGFQPDAVLQKHSPILNQDTLLGLLKVLGNMPIESATVKGDVIAIGEHGEIVQKEGSYSYRELPKENKQRFTQLPTNNKSMKKEHPKKVLTSVGKSSTKYVLPTSVILGALYKIYPDIATDPHTISLVTAGVGIVWANFIKVLEGLLKIDLNQDNKIG